MNKFLRALVASAMVIPCLFCFTGCKKKTESKGYVEVEAIEVFEETKTALIAYNGVAENPEVKGMTFTTNGTEKFEMLVGGEKTEDCYTGSSRSITGINLEDNEMYTIDYYGGSKKINEASYIITDDTNLYNYMYSYSPADPEEGQLEDYTNKIYTVSSIDEWENYLDESNSSSDMAIPDMTGVTDFESFKTVIEPTLDALLSEMLSEMEVVVDDITFNYGGKEYDNGAVGLIISINIETQIQGIPVDLYAGIEYVSQDGELSGLNMEVSMKGESSMEGVSIKVDMSMRMEMTISLSYDASKMPSAAELETYELVND